jgi:hypothetical protein
LKILKQDFAQISVNHACLQVKLQAPNVQDSEATLPGGTESHTIGCCSISAPVEGKVVSVLDSLSIKPRSCIGEEM